MLQSFRANLLEWGVVWVEYLLVWWWRRKAQICQCCLGRGGSSRRCGDATGDRFFMVVKEREFVEGRVSEPNLCSFVDYQIPWKNRPHKEALSPMDVRMY